MSQNVITDLGIIFIIITGLAIVYDPSKLTVMNLFVLNGNTIYFSIICADHIKSTKFITFLESKLNMKTF
jgi:hypothetical protein